MAADSELPSPSLTADITLPFDLDTGTEPDRNSFENEGIPPSDSLAGLPHLTHLAFTLTLTQEILQKIYIFPSYT